MREQVGSDSQGRRGSSSEAARRRRKGIARGLAAAIGVAVLLGAAAEMGSAGGHPAGPGAFRTTLDDVPAPLSSIEIAHSAETPDACARPCEDGAAPAAERGLMEWDGRGPWGGNVKSFAVDPTSSSRVLVVTGLSAAREAGGVWVSTDGGVNWADSDLGGIAGYMLAASHSEPGVFYAGIYDGLYRSEDYGDHWTRIAFNAIIIGCGVKADDGNILIAGLSGGAGIRRSTDRGQTWQTCGVGSGYMKGFGTSPANPSRMYLAMSSATVACYRSDDGGASWTPFGPSGDGWGLWVDPADAEHAYLSTSAGVYRTVNGGQNWTLVLSGTCYANVSVKGGVAYAPLVGSGVFESDDGGDTWTNYNAGITANFFYCSAATSAGALAGHYGGIYRTEAPTSSWIVSQTGLDNAYVRTIAYYADRGELWAGTDQSGLWRSLDHGQTWELKSSGLGDWATYRLAPKDHEHAQGDRMFITTWTGVYRSTDYGESWQPIGFSGTFMRGILIDPADPDRVWTGTGTTQQVWRSQDGGDSWQQVGSGITSGFYPDFQMGRNPVNGPRLFVNYEQMANKIYYSDDLGVSFTGATGLEGTTYQPSLTVRDADPSLVFCGTDAGVYRSTDYGVTWTPSGGLTSVIWSLLAAQSEDVYAGRNRYGVYRSLDDAATWEALNTNIETLVIWDLCYGEDVGDLLCSPRGHGVKQLTLETMDTPEPPLAATAGARLTPNPFAGASSLRLQLPAAGELQVRIFDPAGQIVRAHRQSGPAGERVWTWDGRDEAGRRLPSGSYYYEVLGAGEKRSGRWVIVR